MSGITDDQRKAFIIAMVQDENGVLAANMTLLWSLYSWVGDAVLHDLYVRRDSINLVLAELRNSVDIVISFDSSVSAHQRVTTLQNMLRDVNTQITAYSKSLGGAAISVGQLTRVTPEVTPFPGELDANNPVYGGDPYRRTVRPL